MSARRSSPSRPGAGRAEIQLAEHRPPACRSLSRGASQPSQQPLEAIGRHVARRSRQRLNPLGSRAGQRRMKICFVVNEFFGWGKYGGFGSATRMIATGLAANGVEGDVV